MEIQHKDLTGEDLHENKPHTHTDLQLPIGSVFLAVVATNPAILLGYGTWTQIASGKMLIGQDDGDEDFDTAEKTGGAKTANLQHTHTVTSNVTLDAHTKGSRKSASSGTSFTPVENPASHTVTNNQVTSGNGGNTAQPILNPYFVVYIWKRTA